MRILGIIGLLVVVGSLVGCESERATKLAEDQKNFHDVTQSVKNDLQWKLDDATATHIFDDGTQAGLNAYLTFRKCHDDPPTKDANKKRCEVLQKRVADAEAKADKEKGNW